MVERDFSHRKYFPGTTGNPFDSILHLAVIIESLPGLLFALLLLVVALLPTRLQWPYILGLWAFFLLDWALIGALPAAGRSYGPAHPPVLVLACLRAVVALLPPVAALPLQVIGTLLVVYGFWIEPHTIKVTHQTLHSPRLQNRQPIRLLHLGDLHIERVTSRERQLNSLVQSLNPDIILFSGDFLNLSYLRDPQAQSDARKIIGAWSAPFGVYAVAGSPAVDLENVVPSLLEGLPIRWLQDEKVTLEIRGQPIDVVGVSCTHKPFLDSARLEQALATPLEHFSILLYHSPDLAPAAARSGFDLQLSGHTHGGQVRLPFIGALFTGSLYGKVFEAGRMQIGRMVLYISRGIGMEGAGAPRVRFLCPPEIILWELVAE